MNNRIFLLAILALFFLVNARTAHAHRVNLFAWQEGDAVNAQAYWANGKKASGASLQVLDQAGAVLFRGRTDSAGMCIFKVPGPGKFRIVLNAGMGHRAETEIECTLPGSEGKRDFTSPAALSDHAAGAVSAGHVSAFGDANSHETRSCQAVMCGSMKEMEFMLDGKLAPVMAQLAAIRERQSRIRPRDVIGGLGYIIGLAGLALWASARRNSE